MLEAQGVAEFDEVEMVLGVFCIAGVVPTGEDEVSGGGMAEGTGEKGE